MSEIIIAEWPKNSRETLRVRIDNFKGQAVIDCRAWYQSGDGNWRPGRGGLTVSIRHIPELATALAKALKTAKAAGLIPSNRPQTE